MNESIRSRRKISASLTRHLIYSIFDVQRGMQERGKCKNAMQRWVILKYKIKWNKIKRNELRVISIIRVFQRHASSTACKYSFNERFYENNDDKSANNEEHVFVCQMRLL